MKKFASGAHPLADFFVVVSGVLASHSYCHSERSEESEGIMHIPLTLHQSRSQILATFFLGGFL